MGDFTTLTPTLSRWRERERSDLFPLSPSLPLATCSPVAHARLFSYAALAAGILYAANDARMSVAVAGSLPAF